MNITSPTTTPVPQLPAQLNITPVSQPQPFTSGWGEPMDQAQPEPDAQSTAHEADQTPKVRNKRSLFGPKISLSSRWGGGRPTAPVSPAPSVRVPTPSPVSPGPSIRVPPAPVNPTATRLQTALGGKKPATIHDTPGTSPTAGSANQTTADKLRGALTKGPQTSTSGGPVTVKPVDPPTVSMADVTQRLLDADRLVKAGVISTSPSTAKTIKDAFINAGVNGVVSAPINVGAYAGSVAAGEAIKGQYLPSPVPPPPPHLPGVAQPDQKPTSQAVASSTSDEPAPAAKSHLDQVEAVVLEFANVIIMLAGSSEDGLAMDDSWPKEPEARLSNLERLLSLSETHMKQVAEDNGVLFKPHTESQASPGSEGRLGVIERRYRALENAADKIITLKNAEAKKAEGTV